MATMLDREDVDHSQQVLLDSIVCITSISDATSRLVGMTAPGRGMRSVPTSFSFPLCLQGSLQCCLCVLLVWTEWRPAGWTHQKHRIGPHLTGHCRSHTNTLKLGWIHGTQWQGETFPHCSDGAHQGTSLWEGRNPHAAHSYLCPACHFPVLWGSALLQGPLPLRDDNGIVLLGERAAKCRAYAKALHYKELEFQKGPTPAILESLIR